MADLAEIYREYIAFLNAQDWADLGRYVHPEVVRNGELLRLDGYRQMLKGDYSDIPDLRFTIDLLVVEGPLVASRLLFDCTPRGKFLGLSVNGRRVAFTENVFYAFDNGRIREVWSVVDKRAIEAALAETEA